MKFETIVLVLVPQPFWFRLILTSARLGTSRFIQFHQALEEIFDLCLIRAQFHRAGGRLNQGGKEKHPKEPP